MRSAQYQYRKCAQRCTRQGCTQEPLGDNNECRLHRDMSRDRKRYWHHFRRFRRRPVQLRLPIV